MRRVLPRAVRGVARGVPAGLGEDFVLQPAVVTDKSDGKLAHLDGLELARAWMLEGVAAGLGADDPRTAAVSRCARAPRGRPRSRSASTTKAATGSAASRSTW